MSKRSGLMTRVATNTSLLATALKTLAGGVAEQVDVNLFQRFVRRPLFDESNTCSCLAFENVIQ